MRGLWLTAALVALAVGSGVAASGAAAQSAAGPTDPNPRPRTVPPTPPGPTDTLRGALIQTYNSNPTLTAERSNLRSVDEGVAIARAQGRPQVIGNVGLNQDVISSAPTGRNFSAGVSVAYPLFNGGRTRNSILAADARVNAGRATLRATEGSVFTDAVTAYMDVIRDRSIVELNLTNVRVLQTNLQATRDRFAVGDVTRTDVAQSEARLELARSSLSAAEGRLRASEENFRRVIGSAPGDLQPPPPLPPLPRSGDEAVAVALDNNPQLAAIAEQARAAGIDVQVVRAGRLPTLSATSSGSYVNYLGSAQDTFGTGAPNAISSAGVGVTASIPLYQGGLIGARVRQGQAIESQLIEQSIETERAIVSNAQAAYASFQAAQAAIASNQIAVAADQLALEGVRAEQTVGTRTVLDVLNAEQELVNAQVALVTARHDAYVAGFQLLNAIGHAEATDLNLDGGPLYNPVANYNRVAHRASDWHDDPNPTPVSTRTAPASAPSLINRVVEGNPAAPPPDPTGEAPANSPVTRPRQ